jgi:hypothetical protein
MLETQVWANPARSFEKPFPTGSEMCVDSDYGEDHLFAILKPLSHSLAQLFELSQRSWMLLVVIYRGLIMYQSWWKDVPSFLSITLQNSLWSSFYSFHFTLASLKEMKPIAWVQTAGIQTLVSSARLLTIQLYRLCWDGWAFPQKLARAIKYFGPSSPNTCNSSQQSMGLIKHIGTPHPITKHDFENRSSVMY